MELLHQLQPQHLLLTLLFFQQSWYQQMEQQMMQRAKAAANATNGYVHENPWPSIGVAAGVAFVAGLLIGRR